MSYFDPYFSSKLGKKMCCFDPFMTLVAFWVDARTIDEYDVTMLVSYIRVTSQINGGDVKILNKKRLSIATTAKSAIDNCFGGIESGHQIACKK